MKAGVQHSVMIDSSGFLIMTRDSLTEILFSAVITALILWFRLYILCYSHKNHAAHGLLCVCVHMFFRYGQVNYKPV